MSYVTYRGKQIPFPKWVLDMFELQEGAHVGFFKLRHLRAAQLENEGKR